MHRLEGLDTFAVQHVVATAQALALGRAGQAEVQLASVRAQYPDHPEVLRLHAGILNLRGDYAHARIEMERAVALRPLDGLYHNTLATVLGSAGEFHNAIRELHRACELDPGLAAAWFNLGVLLTRCVRIRDAADALQRAVSLAPANMDARAMLGELLRIQGRVEESAAEYREMLRERPSTGLAWWGLADLRVGALDNLDIERMRSVLHQGDASDDDRIAIGFALARGLDEQGRYGEALDALKHAHALARLRQHWDARAFSAMVDDGIAALSRPPNTAEQGDLGKEVIFIVGMPRSGTTLTEQILASHSQVQGSGELPDLPRVMTEEASRSGKPFPQWVAGMGPSDWQRLGERYLRLTAYWQRDKQYFTDKLPNNWVNIGVIRAMLPGAHVVICRRDPLETCFSCYRQYLVSNEYTRTPQDLAAFWRTFDRSANHWSTLDPQHVYEHGYEALQSDLEAGIRKLLEFCGLPFESTCLQFHRTQRSVCSPSATQVRRPLQTDTAHTWRYGALLDPLREALGLPAFSG